MERLITLKRDFSINASGKNSRISFRLTACVALALLCFAVKGQGKIANYVTNPSFEEIQTLSWHPFGHWVTGWSAIDTTNGAFLPRTVGPPFYNAPGGPGIYQYPRTGNNHILSTYYCHDISCPDSIRGYPRNRLKSLLDSGKVYCGQYYVNIRNASPLGIADFAMLIAGSEIDTIKYCRIPLPYLSPQIAHTGAAIVDTLKWTAVHGTFVAQGHEKYVVLGNFKANYATHTVAIQTSSVGANFTDAYFDDVSLVEMELPAFAGHDTNIVFGDSLYLGRDSDVGIDYACQWFELPNDSVSIDTIAGLWVKPTKKTTYVVRQQLWCSGVKWDTVTVGFDVVGMKDDPFRNFRVYPSVTNGKVDVCGLAEPGFEINVSDITGKSVAQYLSTAQFCTEISLALSEGIYFVTVSKDKVVSTRKIIVSN